MKKLLTVTALFTVALFNACGGGSSNPGQGGNGGGQTPSLQSITVGPNAPVITAGGSQQFTATGHYSDSSTQDLTSQVTWSSSAPGVVTISAGGMATSVGPGNATITATKNAISGTATMTVNPAPINLTSIAVSPSTPSIPLGTLQQFVATGSYSDGSTKDISASVLWMSAVPSTASITNKGMVTANAVGSSDISATLGSISGKTTASVNTANVVSMKILPADSSIANGTKQQLAALVTFNDGSTLNVSTAQGVSWTSSDGGVATIGAGNGYAASVAPGTTMITASYGTASASTNLTVNNTTLQSLAVSPGNDLLAPGLTQKFSAIGTFSDGSTQNISSIVTWTSDNNGVATISNNIATVGIATAVGQGAAHIKATYNGGVNGSTVLNVSNATLQSVTVTPNPNPANLIATFEVLQFTATGNFSDGTTAPLTFAATWNSSDSTVANINSSGLATGAAGGSTNITAAFNGVTSAAVPLTVNGSPLVSLAVKCKNTQFAIGTSQPCTAEGTLADSTVRNMTPVVHWTSSDTSVATISNTSGLRGNISGVSAGDTTITAYLNGIVGTNPVSVTNAHLDSIDVTPASNNINLGGTQVFQALGHFDDGTSQNLASEPAYLVQLEGDDRPFVYDVIFVNWTSSDPKVAVINKAGVATSTGLGTASITATLAGASGTTDLTVQ